MSPERGRIIIGEDSEIHLGMLHHQMEQRGHSVLGSFDTPHRGIDLLNQLFEEGEKIDVIILDGSVGDSFIGGRQLIQLLKERGIPIICISGGKYPPEWAGAFIRKNLGWEEVGRRISSEIEGM